MTSQHSANVFEYLTVKPLVTYGKGKPIYTRGPDSLYMVFSGCVQVSRGTDTRRAVLKIVGANGLFGESCLIGGTLGEEVTALAETRIMAWGPAEIERRIESAPMLGVALMQEVIDTLLNLEERLVVGATCTMGDRLLFTLLQLAHSSGAEVVGKMVRMPPLNHRTLAGHVGTTRGIVTTQMACLKRLGLLTYSRRHIDVDCDAITKVLSSHGVRINRHGTLTARLGQERALEAAMPSSICA